MLSSMALSLLRTEVASRAETRAPAATIDDGSFVRTARFSCGPTSPIPDEPEPAALAAEMAALLADGAGLVRVLDARNQNVAAAADLLQSIAHFRARVCPAELTPASCPTALASKNWYFAGHTRAGWPVLIGRCKLWRPNEYADLDEYVRYTAYLMEVSVSARMAASVTKHMLIVDLSQWGEVASHFSPFAWSCVQHLFVTITEQYPERLGACVTVNASWLFYAAWPFIALRIDANTRRKILIAAGSDSVTDPPSRARAHAVLSRFVADDVLERCYGGTHSDYPHPNTYGSVVDCVARYSPSNPAFDAVAEQQEMLAARGAPEDDTLAGVVWTTTHVSVKTVQSTEIVVRPAAVPRVLRWRMRCVAKDIGFSVTVDDIPPAYRDQDYVRPASHRILIYERRVVHRGECTIPPRGAIVRFDFDNTFSWLTNKKLRLQHAVV